MGLAPRFIARSTAAQAVLVSSETTLTMEERQERLEQKAVAEMGLLPKVLHTGRVLAALALQHERIVVVEQADEHEAVEAEERSQDGAGPSVHVVVD